LGIALLAQIGDLIGLVFLALSLIALVYTLIAAFVVPAYLSGPPADPKTFPSISVLKPLYGLEPGLEDNLKSFIDQDYPGPIQYVFGVQDPADPAIAVVNALLAANPGLDASLVIDEVMHGGNRKVSNLINIERQARNAVVVLSDSDIRVDPRYLRHLVAELEEPGLGAITCLYVGRPIGGIWSKLAAMSINHHFLPNVVMGVTLGLAKPCFGSTVALKRSVLDDVGGFKAVADHLADDFVLGQLVREKGFKTRVSSWTISHMGCEPSAAELIAHEIRWARTIRVIEPAGFVGSGIAYGVPFAFIACLVMPLQPLALWFLLASLFARILLAWRVDNRTGCHAGALWLVPIRDMLSFIVFVGACFTNSVMWRGRRFRIHKSGTIYPVEDF
jgi:ceramide glucosyltransferase